MEAADPSLLQYMKKYWTSNTGSAESFWEHEWGKHGTCISTLDPNCYTDYQPTEEVPDFFSRTVNLFKSLPSYQWLSDAGITPSSSKTYNSDDIQAALSKNHGGKKVYLGCTSAGELDEIWYFYNVRGSLQTGTFVPADSLTDSSCSGNVKYLPKSGGGGDSPSSTSAPSSTAPSSSSGPSTTPTGTPFSGKGYLNVITSGSKKGCIISGGTWYTTGTCAGFTATSSGNGFTLKSSKGDCAVSDGKLTCGSGVSSASSFSSDGGSLAYNGGSTFYADSVPSGSTQGTVYASSDGHGVSLSVEWQSI
jgi:ribonuclease T2